MKILQRKGENTQCIGPLHYSCSLQFISIKQYDLIAGPNVQTPPPYTGVMKLLRVNNVDWITIECRHL